MAWNAWKRLARKSAPEVNILQVLTIDFSEIQFIVNQNSQSDGQNKITTSWTNLRDLILNMKLRSDYRAAVSMQNRLHRESGEPIEELFHPGPQRRKRRGHEQF